MCRTCAPRHVLKWVLRWDPKRRKGKEERCNLLCGEGSYYREGESMCRTCAPRQVIRRVLRGDPNRRKEKDYGYNLPCGKGG